MTQARTTREGFTLVEIMIALAIIGVLGAVIVPNFMSYLERSRRKAIRLSLVGVKKEIETFNADTHRYPEKLRDLAKKPSYEIKGWDGPYLTQEVIDPWGEPIQYKATPNDAKRPYQLYSFGPSKRGAPKEEWISVWD